ncbi:MAG: hypothetical protein NT061_09420 [Spirochaetes bacterium]|nr:hypothetical protein [Spirochaetota bacterium]
MADSYILKAGALALPGTMLESGTLGVQRGIIDYVGAKDRNALAAEDPRYRGRRFIDLCDSVVLPRLTEMHIHGAFGIGFEALRGKEELRFLAGALRKRGIGCFLPTILWDETAVTSLVSAIEDSGLPRTVIPGIYLEGPFINPKKRGGIGLEQIHEPDPLFLARILELTKGLLKVMTLAPELEGIEALYPMLREAGVLISLGHSAASGATALPSPSFSVTHLFNAMTGLDHREGGLATVALSGRARWAELNADGIHVNAGAMKVVSQCIPLRSLILTSDAIAAAGLSYGKYSYFGKAVVSDSRGVRYEDLGTLIGSNKLGIEIVLSFSKATGSSLAASIVSMSKTPGEALGLDPAEAGGSIEIGASDDLYAWDRDLKACRSLRELAGGES